MRKSNPLIAIFLLVALAALGLVAGPLAAKPGAHPVLGQLDLSQEQQQQIQNLRSAFREQFDGLDWSFENGGHDPDTLQRARELQLALSAEVRDVLTEEQRQALDAARRGSCPHSGKAVPVSTRQDTTTLFL